MSCTGTQTIPTWAPPRFFLGEGGEATACLLGREFAYKLTVKPTLIKHLKLFLLTILVYSGQNNIYF